MLTALDGHLPIAVDREDRSGLVVGWGEADVEDVSLLGNVDQRKRLTERFVGGGFHLEFVAKRARGCTEGDSVFSDIRS